MQATVYIIHFVVGTVPDRKPVDIFYRLIDANSTMRQSILCSKKSLNVFFA